MTKNHPPYQHLAVLRVAHDPSRFRTATPFRRSPDHPGRQRHDAARRSTRPGLRDPGKPACGTAAKRRDHPHHRRPATPPPSPPARRNPRPRRLPGYRPDRSGRGKPDPVPGLWVPAFRILSAASLSQSMPAATASRHALQEFGSTPNDRPTFAFMGNAYNRTRGYGNGSST